MKHYHSIVALILIAVLAWSCGEKDNLDPLGEWDITTAVLQTPESGTDIVLNEATPGQKFRFDWQPATTTNRFIIQYTYLLMPAGSTNYDKPILSITTANAGRSTFVEPTAEQIDYALWAACYPAGEKANLAWVVQAKSIDRVTIATQNIAFTRFETEREITALYLSGGATEGGADATRATLLRAQKNADGELTGIFDVYAKLTKGETFFFRDKPIAISKVYGLASGALAACGTPIEAPASAIYRITVNLNTNTYELLEITRWSLVGDAVEGGWGGDVPLPYKGNGVWEGKINFVNAANFIFRANGEWAYLLKRIVGTGNAANNGGRVVMESEAGGAGLSFEDVPAPLSGMHTVTLDLSAEGYTYLLVSDNPVTPVDPLAVIGNATNPNADQVNGNFDFGDYEIPAQLFLIHNGTAVAEFTKNGNIFESGKYIALEEDKTYTLNSANDGSGTTYNELTQDGSISIARDQAYKITVNFETGKLIWEYFNIKLFHWDDAGGGWDARQEIAMTYEHPYTFKFTGATLSAGFDSKFNSPWVVQFGTGDMTLTGTMTNGGANYKGIVSSGTYNATIVVSDKYETCTYTFVKQ